MKKAWLALILLPVFYMAGPVPDFEPQTFHLAQEKLSPDEAESRVKSREENVAALKPGNASEIIWYRDSARQKTEKVVLYLHGFSASPYEGRELAELFGKRYGCNVYLPRLEDHGRDDPDTFRKLTPASYIQSAIDAWALAKNLGDSVILISCSSGATLGLILAAEGLDIHSHFMFSPNVEIANQSTKLLAYPWGKQIGKLVLGGEYNVLSYQPEQAKYWNTKYHLNGIIALQYLLDNYINTATFQKITHPVFMGYYFKDDKNQDEVVSVPAMQNMFEKIRTKPAQKRALAFAEAGSHMMICRLFSRQMDDIIRETFLFAEEVLQMKPVNTVQ